MGAVEHADGEEFSVSMGSGPALRGEPAYPYGMGRHEGVSIGAEYGDPGIFGGVHGNKAKPLLGCTVSSPKSVPRCLTWGQAGFRPPSFVGVVLGPCTGHRPPPAPGPGNEPGRPELDKHPGMLWWSWRRRSWSDPVGKPKLRLIGRPKRPVSGMVVTSSLGSILQHSYQ